MTGRFHDRAALLVATSFAIVIAIDSVSGQAKATETPPWMPENVVVEPAPQSVDRGIIELGTACSAWMHAEPASRVSSSTEPRRELAEPEATICTHVVDPAPEEIGYAILGGLLTLALVLPAAAFFLGVARDAFRLGGSCCGWLIGLGVRSLSWSRSN